MDFQLVYMVDYVYQFMCVEQFLHLWDETYLIRVDDLVDVFLDSIYKYFMETFYIYIQRGNWLCSLTVSSKIEQIPSLQGISLIRKTSNSKQLQEDPETYQI